MKKKLMPHSEAIQTAHSNSVQNQLLIRHCYRSAGEEDSPEESRRLVLGSFRRSLELLQKVLHLQVEVGLSFLRLFAQNLKRLFLLVLVLLDGCLFLLLVRQKLLGNTQNRQVNSWETHGTDRLTPGKHTEQTG